MGEKSENGKLSVNASWKWRIGAEKQFVLTS
jgi:hypothetical protein